MAKLRRMLVVWTILSAGLPAYASQAAAVEGISSNVRTDNARIGEVFEYARKQSPSFGDLLATLDTLDRIVYVEEGTCRHRELRACLQLMPTPGGRHILIRIDPRQQMRSAVRQLAHELYHALEVAREPDATDPAAVHALYERIGERSCAEYSGDCFETRAAVAFEALVGRQLTKGKNRSETHDK